MKLSERLRLYASKPSAVLTSARSVVFRLTKLRPILAGLRPGDRVVDCGANVGDYAALFADRGATVYAFEPHPVAFECLSRRFAGDARVVCMNKAVGLRPGSVKLYLGLADPDDPRLHSQSASLLPQKRNVDPGNAVDVEAVSLAEFLESLGGPVALLKMDVEGAEYDLLEDLMDRGLHRGIRRIVVETHQDIPGVLPRHEALLRRVRDGGLRNIDLGWH